MCVSVVMPDFVATVNLDCFVATDYHRELIHYKLFFFGIIKMPHTLWSFIMHVSWSGCFEVTCRMDGTEQG